MPDLTITLTADARGYVAAMRRAALSWERFDVNVRIASATGWRRHGLVKHARDLRRRQAKRLAALVAEGHTSRSGRCPVCGATEAEEHVLRRTG